MTMGDTIPSCGLGKPTRGWIAACIHGATASVRETCRTLIPSRSRQEAATAPKGTTRDDVRREISALCHRLKIENPGEWGALAAFSPQAEAAVRRHLAQVAREKRTDVTS
ncbi:MAG: hypothetical protein JNL10_14395 [Verrucomicrobiales bacterium]|nr:hypothetical protein [Verrucomicrobiales bacterium]